jgi:hypothetical protein
LQRSRLPDTFLANVCATNEEYAFDYDTNTMLTGDTELLSDLVEDDEFRANVVVDGSHSYDTQIGGHTTVPQLDPSSSRLRALNWIRRPAGRGRRRLGRSGVVT